MLRVMLAVAALVLVASLAAAQSNPIAARKALMKANGDQAKIGTAMAKGEAPFDQAKVQTIFATFIDAAGKFGALFPENSKTGGDTSASPEIWVHMDDFKARFAKLAADSKAALETVKDRESFTAAYRNVNQTCDGCHEHYRVKKS